MTTVIGPYAANKVKPNVTYRATAYAAGVKREKKKVYWEKSKSKVQTIFVRRLNEVMEARGLSDNGLARLIAPKDPASVQRSVSRITGCHQDPSLEKVSQIVEALDIPPAMLFTDELVSQRTPLLSGRASQTGVVNSKDSAMQNRAVKKSRSGNS